jgi:PAS domain S-box-containing protein
MGKKELQKTIKEFNRALGQGSGTVYRRSYDSDSYDYIGDYIEEISGYSAKEITPALWDSLIMMTEQSGELAGIPLPEAKRLFRKGEVENWQSEVQIHTRSGEKRWVTDMCTVIRDEEGNCTGCLGVLQDVTESKEAVRELTAITNQLRSRNREMEDDLAMARDVQQALVTQQPPQFPLKASETDAHLHFYHRYIPAAMLAGDFYEILAISETEVGVFICDVMGHGVRAALLTTFIRGLMEELMPVAGSPDGFLNKINRSLMAVFGQSESYIFATACYLVIDVKSGHIRFANAGHSMPLSLQSEKGVVLSLDDWSQESEPALGIVEEYLYSVKEYTLDIHESVLLFTDGLFEAYNAHDMMYGEERLATFLKQHLQLEPEQLLDRVLDDVLHFTGNAEFEDDVCLLAIVPTPPSA